MNKGSLAIAAAILLALGATPALAAELGRVEFGGRTVILDEDGTWAYAAPNKSGKGAACPAESRVASAVVALTLCVDPGRWSEIDPGPEQEFTFMTTDGAAGMALIAERLPFGSSFLRTAILENAAEASGVSADEIEIVEEGTATIAGQSWEVIRYRVDFEGTRFEYFNYYRSQEGFGSSQIVFWTLENFVPRVRGLFDAVIAGVASSP